MALARKQFTCVDENGNVLPGASVEVRQEVGGQPLAAVYEDRDGLTPLGNPFQADANGFAAFHVAGGAYQIKVTSGTFSLTWRYEAVGTAAEFDAETFTAGRNILVSEFNAKGDGVTDDTAAIQAAVAFLESSGGGYLHFEPGRTYKITDTVEITGSHIRLVGHGAKIDATSLPIAVEYNTVCAFRVKGMIDETGTAITGDVAAGDKQINVASTTGLAAGDLIFLRSADQEWPPGVVTDPGESRRGALHFIRSIDSGTSLTLSDGAFFDYLVSGNATVKKVTPVENVILEDLAITAGGADTAHCGVLLFHAVDCWLMNVRVDGGEDANCRFNACMNGGVNGGEFRDATSPDAGSSGVTVTTGYGVHLAHGSRNLEVTRARFRNCRHAVTGGGDTSVVFCIVEDNHVMGSRFPTPEYDLECHEECSWWTFRGNKISGSLDSNGSGGIMVRGQNCVVEGNHVANARQYGILVQNFEENPNGIDGVKIVNNVIDGSRLHGINIAGSTVSPIKNVDIRGNTIRNIDGNGDGIRLSVTRGGVLSDNTILNAPATSSGIRLIGSSTQDDFCADITLSANRVDSVGNFGYRLQFANRIAVSDPYISNVVNGGIIYDTCVDVAQNGGYISAPSGTVSPVQISACARVTINGGVLEAGGTPSTNSGVSIFGGTVDASVIGTIVNNCNRPISATGSSDWIMSIGVNGRNCTNASDLTGAANNVELTF